MAIYLSNFLQSKGTQMNNKAAALIFAEWKASLARRNRSRKSYDNNFDDLFSQLKNNGISFEEAYDLLPLAIKAHLPAPSLVKTKFSALRKLPSIASTGMDEKEFAASWHKAIEDAATNVFFLIFPLLHRICNH